jgi:eukaryotic-like serine/threonine-protein kinase
VTSGVPFGEYRLVKRLGAGGMAEVFLAKRIGPAGFEKQLVIKRILPHLSASERFTQMFLKEARLAALIDHPNLVHVSSFGEIAGNYYLAMEYVDGVTIADLLGLVGTVSPGVACRIGIDLLGALQAIHTAADTSGRPLGLVHRDVSPRNVMLTRDGAVKLLDFGIAISREETVETMLVGTRRHMSPEQMRGQDLDGRSDLFCVGVLLYEMICGDPPFEGIPIKLPEHPSSVPPDLWATIEKLLAIDREGRPPSARPVQSSLELLLAARGIEGTRAHLAELVSELMTPANTAVRALSRITQITKTGFKKLTAPLADDDEEEDGVELVTTSERRGRVTNVRPSAELALDVTSVPRNLLEENMPSATARSRRVALSAAGIVFAAGLSAAVVAKLIVGDAARTSEPVTARVGDGVGAPPVSGEPTRAANDTAASNAISETRLSEAPPPSEERAADIEKRAADNAASIADNERPSADDDSSRDGRGSERAVRRASRARAHSPSAVADRSAESARAKTGLLTIDTKPWTEVWEDGKELGLTPIEGLKLPSGTHELELRNPKLGIVRKVQITIRPGRTTRVQRDL